VFRVLQISVSVFSKSFRLFRSGILAVAIFQVFVSLKSSQVFGQKVSCQIGSGLFNRLRVFCSGFGKQAVSFGGCRACRDTKSIFLACVLFGQVRSLKSASIFSAKFW
jgi:hypothetical protein